MKFFKGNTPPELKPDTTSAADWQSIASGNSVTLHSQHSQHDDDNDGSGFLNPESSLKSNRALKTSEWSKERSSQQIELANVHHTSTGCCRKTMEFLVKALHVIDFSIGMALIVYGSLLDTQFEEPAKAAVVFCLILGTIHLVTSLLGIISLFMRGCSRFGLMISGYVGPYVALVYFTIVISLLVDSSGFLLYLDDHKEVMYLGPNVADNCRKLMPLFYTILISLGLLEASRFCVLLKLTERLLRHDAEESLIPRPSHYETASSSSANNTLTEALLGGNNESETVETGGAVGKETTGMPNWWEK